MTLTKRLRAWAIYHKVKSSDTPLPIWVVPEPLDLCAAPAQFASWISQAETQLGVKVGMIVVDTFSTNLGAGDEQSNADVTQALNNARLAADGRAIVFVHHVGHGEKERERGAYQIRANFDRRVIVRRDEKNTGDLITVECLKDKDDLPFDPVTLEWHQVDTGWRDSDGDAITSVVLIPTDQRPVEARPRGSKRLKGEVQQLVIAALQQAGGTMKSTELREHIVVGMDKPRQSFSEAIKRLKEDYVISVYGPSVRLSSAFRNEGATQ